MRKENGKRLINLLLCLILTLSLGVVLVACGNTSQPSGGSESNTESESKTPAECTVTFETYEGSEIDPITVMSGEYAEKPENPVKTGHVFKGWYLDLENTEAGSFVFDETPITEDITLHALWQIRQYQVSFQDENGNAIDGLSDYVADWGSLVTKPDETSIAKDGYLIKWFTASGDIWDFETSKVVTNTILTCRYVTTKDTYNAKDIADNFYPAYDKTNVGAEFCNEHYVDGAETVTYTYDYGKVNNKNGLQQIVLNVELSTLDYSSVTIVFRGTSYAINEETGEYTFDATAGGTFAQYRAYILTDQGGDISFNDEPSSGYNPFNYYIQSTGTNKELCTTETVEGWTSITFDLASLKYWNEAETLYSFAFGYVCSTWAVEFKSVTFNKVDKTQQYEVKFVDRLGNTLAETQTLNWNGLATKPEAIASADGRVYTGEWLDSTGEVFDFSKRIRSSVVLTPEYTIEGKTSWTGAEIAKDIYAVYNETPSLPANEYVTENTSYYVYNNASGGNSLKQFVVDNLNLTKGNIKYLTFTWRNTNDRTNAYNPNAVFTRVRVYLATDLGGHAYDKDLDDKDKFYFEFTQFSTSEVTTPVDMTAKLEDGWYTVTIDLTVLEYFANGTIIKGIGIGTTNGANGGIELKEFAFLEEIPADKQSHTVTYLDEEGNAIDGLDVQTVPYGKTAGMPSVEFIPEKPDYSFAGWVDADGNQFAFGAVLTEDVVLYASYTNGWEGTDISYTGSKIVDSCTTSFERYGSTLNNQNKLTLDDDGNAVGDYVTTVKPNKAITMLNAGIRIHEGSKLVITFKSSAFAEGFGVSDIKIGLAFRGEDPAETIKNGGTNPHYVKISEEPTLITYTITEDGTVTATFDLYGLSQKYAPTLAAGVDASYLEAFTFLYVEKKGSTNSNATTITYYSINFIDVQQNIITENE